MELARKDFQNVCLNAVQSLRELAPKDTGNLAYNAITIQFPTPDTCVIYVDEAIAPYMPYTTYPWLSSKWQGKKNPNEGWWEDAVSYIAEQVNKQLKGG